MSWHYGAMSPISENTQITPTMSLARAYWVLRSKKIEVAPVYAGGKLCGMLSIQDIVSAMNLSREVKVPLIVENFMHFQASVANK
jgi:predicted transcriptional regulator